MKPTWQTTDGTIRLYLGDCREVLPRLQVSVDAVVTDPPYGIVNEFGSNTGQPGKGVRTWDHPEITAEVVQAVGVAFSMCKPSAGCFVFCGGDQFGKILDLVRSNGFTAKPAAWVKDCPPPAGKGNWWPSGFELAVYGYRNGAYFGDSDPKRSNMFRHDSYRYGQPGKVDHPTQKPMKLVTRLMAALVPPGGTGLDCFLGSGTAAVAAARLGLGIVGIERDPTYFALAVSRVEAELSRAPLFEPPPVIQRNFTDL